MFFAGQYFWRGKQAWFFKEELLTVLPDLSSLDQIEYVGLMTMAPFEAQTEELQKIFKETQELQQYIREQQFPNMPMTELSMGMSRDYKEAIQCGSTFCSNWYSIF